MEYYLVMNEWLYPQESGREFIGDFDLFEDALAAAKHEYKKEYDNFLDVNKGEIYEEACGMFRNEDLEPGGFVMNSSKDETENMFFRSVIIKREITR